MFLAISFVLSFLLNWKIDSSAVSSVDELITSATSFLSAKAFIKDQLFHNWDFLKRDEDAYDFIIVGGGSAGSVLANRLSANSKYQVLLLEAGGDPLILNKIPSLFHFNLHKRETDWGYKTVPQRKSCFAYKHNVMPVVGGKSLGGSSNLHALIYQRGCPKDFDNWGNVTGDSSWNYENVLPYFKRFENYHGVYPKGRYHGVGGEVTISRNDMPYLIQEWLASGREKGYPNIDPNSEQVSSFSYAEFFKKRGRRVAGFDAYIRPVLQRQNLRVVRYAQVTKVIIDHRKRAVGVQYVKNGRRKVAFTLKEVILSTGAIGSPKLLMLSGIGKRKDLEELGINPVISDLPVGDNYQDHVLTLVGPFVLNDTVSFLADRDVQVKHILQYFTDGTGPLAFSGAVGIGLVSVSDPREDSWPNIYGVQIPVGIHQLFGKGYGQVFGMRDGTMQKFFKGYEGRDTVILMMNLARPRTTGTIKLASSNSFENPLLDPNYYDVPKDMEDMISGMKFFINLFESTEAWQKYNATLIQNHFPGCESFKLRSDKYFECHIRHLTASSWHPCCTAPMGKAGNPGSVVDTALRVIGVDGLRVVDASVMPVIPNANINAPVLMIAEKGADMILKEYEEYSSSNEEIPPFPLNEVIR